MKYRTKLYLALVGVSLASIVLALVIFSTETEKLTFRMLQSRTLSIAATAASQLDPELVKRANFAKSKEDPAYLELRDKLRKVVEANRRKDIFVSDLYTLYPDPSDPKRILFGVNTYPQTPGPGTPYTNSDADLILKNRGNYFADNRYVSDQFGNWLSGYAPLFDENGDFYATLGVDINSADIQSRLEDLIRYAIFGLIASFALSLIIAYFLAKKVTRSLDHLCDVVEDIAEGDLQAKANLESEDEFGELSKRINAMTVGLQERDRLKLSFARYVSTHILNKILQSETPLKLEGERRKVTLLFSDIRQFTQLAENLPPEEVVFLLNEYFEVMIEVIFSHHGTLDKFIGDGIMAEFGAPLDDENQEEHAIQAAIEMQKALLGLCEKWEKEGKPRIQMGIGIHTGDAVVGNIGSEKRTEYTAIGDAVNVAARLEQATKILKTTILISETTYLGAKDKFYFEDLGTMAIPGRKEQIKVFSLKY